MSSGPAIAAPGPTPSCRLSPGRAAAGTIFIWSAFWYAAYGWAALARLDVPGRPVALVAALAILAGVWAAGTRRPLVCAVLLLAGLPLFGNHPGGRLMEIVNLPLAACAAGLALDARRHQRPPPTGAVWLAAALYLLAAVIAIVPAVPGMMIRSAQLNDWPTIAMEALTTSEENPLYSVSSLVGLTLCGAWAWALAWRSPGQPFFVSAIRAMTWTLLLVVGIGILDYHGLIAIAPSYLLRIDPRSADLSGFQSIFWNPGWFAWYFVLVFALALGFLWSARPAERRIAIVLLAVAYAYFLANPQRGGFVALHVSLGLAALVLAAGEGRRDARRVVPIAAAALVAVVAGAYAVELIPRTTGSSLFRLLAVPDETTTSNTVRMNLWSVALQMWRDAPVFGIGEGSFAWRFRDYAAPGSALDTPLYGDAHNTWLQVLATRGLAGFAGLLALVAAVGRSIYRAWLPQDPGGRGVLLGVSLSLAAFLVYSVVQGMFYLQSIQILFWFIVAGAASRSETPPAAAPRPWLAAAIAAAVVVALIAQFQIARPLFAQASATITRQPRGFYPVEAGGGEPSPWRWSVREGTLCLQPPSPNAVVRMTTGDPRRRTYPRTVTLRVDGRLVERFVVRDAGMITRTLRLPAPAVPSTPTQPFGECAGGSREVRLTVTVDRTWNPLAARLAPDARTLGVAVFEPVYPRAGEPPPDHPR